MPSKRLTSRFVNGAIAALITVFFLVHGLLGGFSLAFGFSSSLSWLAWGAVALVAVHVIASVVTSQQQLSDKERPPSARKKRHLALKWITGALLGASAAVHVALPGNRVSTALVIAVVAATLAVHLCVGSKSLLKDLGIDRRYQLVFRVVVCACAATFAILAIVGGA